MRAKSILLGTLLSGLFLGCSDNKPPPSSHGELEERVRDAVKKNDFEEFESLFFELPQQWINGREVTRQAFNALRESGFTTRRVGFLHSPTTICQSWSIDPEEFLRIEGIANPEHRISIGFFLGTSKGFAYIVFPSDLNTPTEQATITYCLVSSPNVDLGNKLPATFQSSWSGGDAKSYSMDNLAASLTRFSGVTIINRTAIEGDYDFSLPLNAAQDPSNIKMDLQSIGLDLVREDEIHSSESPGVSPEWR
jgi:hypothetical protein